MEKITINEQNIDIKQIEKIAEEIKKGKIAIFPTETVYGIGTNAFNEDACKKIYEIKGRPKEKPLIILISNMKMLESITKDIQPIEKKLIDRFWPGPLTIIMKKRENISNIITAGKQEVSVRMTNGKLIQLLIQKAEVPIVAPSANLSGKPTGTKPKEIENDFKDNVDYLIDIGIIPSDVTSTIVRVEQGKIHIIREGKIKRKELEKIAEIVI